MTTRTQLWLIRHGESEGNVDGTQSDSPLTARGRAEAERAGEWLSSRLTTGAHIVASPLVRARETAERAVARLAHPGVVHIDARLRELVIPPVVYLDPSTLDLAALEAMLKTPAAPDESGLEFRARLRDFVAWAADSAASQVVAFTHAGVVRELQRSAGHASPPPVDNGACIALWIEADGGLRA